MFAKFSRSVCKATKGIIADRCELNRQIKADNALLKELKSLVKKLMDAAKNTIPAIVGAMEAIRQKMIIFRYHFLHIRSEKTWIDHTLRDVQPDIRRYEDIIKRLKAKIQERRVLLEEKKTMPTLQVFRYRELAQKIAGLTEDIEELKSEKTLLLNQFNCVDDHGMTGVEQRVASMESSLETLNRQEDKYAAELDAALAQYAELRQRAAEMDTTELDAVRQAIRPGKEHKAAQRLQATYQKKFDFRLLTQSRIDVADLLEEVVGPMSIQENLRQSVTQTDKQRHINRRDQER